MKKLDIIYEDKNILVVNKPSKLLTMSDGKTNHTLYSEASDYVKKQHKSNKIFIVHRLDKDTSGLVVFAKNETVKQNLQNNWVENTKREYIAILEGHLKTKEGIIKEYLAEDKTHRVYATTKYKGKYAETYYKVLNETKNNTVVRVEIKTGRKNQIRVGFSNLKTPIIGDSKYGSKTNPINRLGLHATKISLKLFNKEYTFESKVPEIFKSYLKF